MTQNYIRPVVVGVHKTMISYSKEKKQERGAELDRCQDGRSFPGPFNYPRVLWGQTVWGPVSASDESMEATPVHLRVRGGGFAQGCQWIVRRSDGPEEQFSGSGAAHV